MTLYKTLKQLGATCGGLDWAHNKSLERAYSQCRRPDWMLWCAHMIGVDDVILHRLACQFARSVLHLTDDPRCEAAIVAKEQWLAGEISDDKLSAAWAAARDAAGARDAAAAAAWGIAWDAADAAAWAAAWAAARDAAGAGAAADAAAKDTQCDMIRAAIPLEMVKEKLAKVKL